MTVIYRDPKGRRALTRLERNTTLQTVARRCDRVTELAKLQQGQFVRYNCVFDLRALLQSTILPYAHLAKAKGIGFKVSFPADFPSKVQGDPVASSRVCEELVANSLLYTPRNGGIWLLGSTVGPIENRGCLWAGFTLTDTGPGLSLVQQLQLSGPGGASSRGKGFALVNHYMHYLEGSLDIHSHVHGTVIRCLWPLGVVEEGTEQATQRRIIVVYRIKPPAIQPTWVAPSGTMPLTPLSSENHAYGALLQSAAHQASRGLTGASVDVAQGTGSLFGSLPIVSVYESATILDKPTSAARGSASKLPSINPVYHKKPLWALMPNPNANLFQGTLSNQSPGSFELTTSSGPAKYPITSNLLSDSRSTGQHPLATVLLNIPRASTVSHQTPVKITQDRPDPPCRPMEPQWVEETAPAKSKIYYTESGLGYFKEPEETRKRVGFLSVPASWVADVQAMAEQDEWIQKCVAGNILAVVNEPLTGEAIESLIRTLKTEPDPIIRQAAYLNLSLRPLGKGIEYSYSVLFHRACAKMSGYTDPDFGDLGQPEMEIGSRHWFVIKKFFRCFLSLSPTATCFQDRCFLEALQGLAPFLTSESAPFNWTSNFFWRQDLASFKNALERCITSVEATIYFRLYLVLQLRGIDHKQAWDLISQAIGRLVESKDYPALQRVEEYLYEQVELGLLSWSEEAEKVFDQLLTSQSAQMRQARD